MMKPESASDHALQADHAFADLVEEITRAIEAGEPVDLAPYEDEYPGYAERLRRLVPALQVLDDIGLSAVRSTCAGRPSKPPATSIEGTLGDFRIQREIGRGGMGVVYEAQQISLGRKVALKVLPFAAMLDQRQLARFQNEARAAASLKHPNIVHVYSVGCERGVHYYAMEYVDGQTLAAVVEELRRASGAAPRQTAEEPPPAISQLTRRLRSGTLSPEGKASADEPTGDHRAPAAAPVSPSADTKREVQARISTEGSHQSRDYFRSVAQLGVQAAGALEHAHQMGVVHRDVKPSNLMVDDQGHLWVTDFGLAMVETGPDLTMTGDVLGTLRYMSPEQAEGGRRVLDHRTDVYSLGVTLYELLTLQAAFDGSGRQALLRRILQDEPISPRQLNSAIPTDLETIVLKATAKEPHERYASAGQLADDLTRFLEHKPIHARCPSLATRAAKWSRRHRPVVWSAVATLLVAVVALAVSTMLIAGAYRGEKHQRSIADEQRRVAQKQQRLAKRQETLAKQQHKRAEEEAQRARHLAEETQQLLYAADIKLAAGAWRENDTRQLLGLLERHRPAAGMKDFRGFEWYYLRQQACTPRGEVLKEHDNRVHCVRCSRDGRWIATAGEDGVIRVCDARTLKSRATIDAEQGELYGVAFAPDGNVLASAGEDGTVHVWDLRNGQPQHTISAHTGTARTVVFSPDGTLLASSGDDKPIRLWNPGTGELLGTLDKHSRAVEAIDISPDGRILASGSDDATVKLWDLKTHEELHHLAKHRNRVVSIAFSNDGKQVASGDVDGLLYVWDVEHGSCLLAKKHFDGVQTIAFAPQDEWFAAGDRSGSVRCWRLESPPRTSSIDDVLSVGENPFASWQAHQGRIRSLAFSPSGDRLLSGANDGRVIAWQGFEPAEPRVVRHSVGVTDFAWVGGTSRVVTINRNATYLSDVEKESSVIAINEEDRRRWSVACSADGQLAAVGDCDGNIRLWDLQSQTIRTTWKLGEVEVMRLAFSPDGSRLACTCRSEDDLVRIFDVQSQEMLPGLLANSCYAVAFSPDSRLLAVSAEGDAIVVWDIVERKVRCMLDGHTNSVSDLAFSPDGQLLASASHDRLVKLWDWRLGSERMSLSGHRDQVRTLAFSPDGATLATAGRDGRLKLWQVATGQPLCDIVSEAEPINKIAFNASGNRLAYRREGSDKVQFLEAPSGETELHVSLRDPGSGRVVSSPAEGKEKLREQRMRRLEGIARRLDLCGKQMELGGTKIDGTPLDWNSYRGKVVQVAFWDTSHGGFHAEVADARFNHRLYRDRGFEIVAVSLDPDRASLEEYLATPPGDGEPFPWATLHDRDAQGGHPLGTYYGITDLPRRFLVDREGKVVSTRAYGRELDTLLEQLLGPPYLPKGRLNYIDLRSCANRKVTLGRTGKPNNSLAELPRGEQTFGGVKFNIADAMIQLASTKLPDRPEKVEIPVNRTFIRLYVLHATEWGEVSWAKVPDGTLVGQFHLNFEDQTTETIPIVYGEDLRDWWDVEGKAVTRSKVAWVGGIREARGEQARLRLYLSAWNNPQPDKKVVGIDYVSANATAASPFCVGMTVEEAVGQNTDRAATTAPAERPESEDDLISQPNRETGQSRNNDEG